MACGIGEPPLSCSQADPGTGPHFSPGHLGVSGISQRRPGGLKVRYLLLSQADGSWSGLGRKLITRPKVGTSEDGEARKGVPQTQTNMDFKEGSGTKHFKRPGWVDPGPRKRRRPEPKTSSKSLANLSGMALTTAS